jgi:type I restriction-modification system DNA methylase subunit
LITEADTCRRYVLPKLYSAGWNDDQVEEAEEEHAGRRFKSSVEPPYRWRDWAAKEDGITGDELIAFINNEEAVKPDGTKSEEIHTLSHLYESMLKEMRDAAGDSGELYTPRPVVRFMVEVIDPKLGELAEDPAAGTGGFLVEEFEHMRKQCQKASDFEILQKKSIQGGEAKPLPYLLCQMNLLFFERGGPTKEIWYYEIPLPEGRKQYNKTQPMQFEEFAPVIEWWKDRKENGQAWKVPAAKVIENGYNLDIKNPNGKADLEHLPPEQLTESILKKEMRIAEIMAEIKQVLAEGMSKK